MKICGITSPEDARLAEDLGADAVGVVLFSDSPRCVSMEEASAIFAATGPFITRVCVSHTRSPDDLESMLTLQPGAVQLFAPLRLPLHAPVKVIRAVAPGDPLPKDADAVTVDASHGSGRLYDREFAAGVVRSSRVPVILAGGLTPENVAGAISAVHPYAVDVATGVEGPGGRKDPRKVHDFIRNARRAMP